MQFDPFMLPVCDCGGATMLASCEPTLRDQKLEIKIYRCTVCGNEEQLDARQRPNRVGGAA
jgi:hypothetical protein